MVHRMEAVVKVQLHTGIERKVSATISKLTSMQPNNLSLYKFVLAQPLIEHSHTQLLH